MAFIFELPDIGEGLTEAEIIEWLVPVGATVAMDEPLVVVETDKTAMEIPSPKAGTVLRHGGGPGEILAIGSVLVELDTGEDEVAPAPAKKSEIAPIVGTLSSSVDLLPPPVHTSQRPATKPRAFPPVRRLAAELGLDLTTIKGSATNGRITRDDVLNATRSGAKALPTSDDPAVSHVEPMSATRRAIARNLIQAWQEIPQVTTYEWANGEAILDSRRLLAQQTEMKIPLEALLIKAIADPVEAHPRFNARLNGDSIEYLAALDVGLAVDTEAGLVVVVVRDVAKKSTVQLAEEFASLVEKAKARQLTRAEMVGQGFTISNIGAANGGFGTPLVPLGTAAIIGVGRARQEAVVRDGVVVAGLRIPLSLSYDHRLIDGAQGRSFIDEVIANIEDPPKLLS